MANSLDESFLSLSDAGSWASLVSLVISVLSLLTSSYAAYGIRRVRTELVNRATLPALTKSLDKHVTAFESYLLDYEKSKDDFLVELGSCEANLRSIGSKVNDRIRAIINGLLWREMRHYRGEFVFSREAPRNSEQDARRIYRRLKEIQTEVRNFLDEQRFAG